MPGLLIWNSLIKLIIVSEIYSACIVTSPKMFPYFSLKYVVSSFLKDTTSTAPLLLLLTNYLNAKV
jgi:hypothetical protein